MRLLVLGGGPAGYIAALRAAQLGASATIVEAREIGGTCLNRGCIPTKALVATADRLRQAVAAASFGVGCAGATVDFAAAMARKRAVTLQLRAGVEQMLKARKVDVIAGRGRLTSPNAIELDDGTRVEADAVVLASGSEPARLRVFDFANPKIVTSDEMLEAKSIPARLAIVGGGVIGCEFAAIFATLGSQVTVVEMLDQLLPGEDKRVGRALQQAFKKQGIEVILKTAVEGVEDLGAAGVRLSLAGGAEVPANMVLVSVGRRPLTRGLGYEECGIGVDEQGFVVVDDTLRTAIEGVFAAGDVAGPPLLAHWAYHQGAIAAENAVTGSRLAVDRRVVPNCVFTHPEVASVGLTEDRALAAGVAVEIAHVRFNGNSKAVIEDEADGFVRAAVEPASGRVLGASLFGPRATELVHELALAVQAELPIEAIMRTIHAHPTLSESVGEAALAFGGRGLHTL